MIVDHPSPASARSAGRAVVTGLGIVAPNGIGAQAYWAATLRGESGIQRLTRFDPSRYTAELAGQTDLEAAGRLPSRLIPQTDLMTRLALVAAEEALGDADADPREMPAFTAGVITAASAGGFEFGQRELEALWSRGGDHVSAYQSFAWFYPVNTGQISIRHGMRGPGGAIVADQAGGLDAIAKARRQLRDGTPFMLSGGVDGSLCPWAWICLIGSGRVTTETDPDRAYVPFDVAASGHVPGEGGALLVLEEEQQAERRGVGRRYGVVAGHGATFDGRPGAPGAPALRRAIDLALTDARMDPRDVDVVFADAAGMPGLDTAEAEIIAGKFGPGAVPVTAPKTMTGRLLGGGGPLDVATALLALRDAVIPPTINVRHPAHSDLIDLVRDEPRPARLRTALVLARGQGGFNSAIALRAG